MPTYNICIFISNYNNLKDFPGVTFQSRGKKHRRDDRFLLNRIFHFFSPLFSEKFDLLNKARDAEKGKSRQLLKRREKMGRDEN